MEKHDKFGNIEAHIVFVPRRTIECDELLTKNRMLQIDKIHTLAIDLLPLEDDLLSLELEDNFARHLL